MREVYRKVGRVVRYENGVLVRVDESGEAIEDGPLFTAAPLRDERDLPAIDPAAVIAAAEGLRSPLMERLIVSEGVAFHSFGDESWSESARRVHVSLANAPYRALVDLATFTTDPIRRIGQLLARVTPRETPPRLRVADHVGAALLPHFCGRIPMQQWSAPHDGKGAWIENISVDGEPPNWFRPSYRARPVRVWFNLRVEPFGDIDPALPEGVALLGPVRGEEVDLLCVDRDRAFACTVRLNHVYAAAPAASWYPYGAGCFGAELVL